MSSDSFDYFKSSHGAHMSRSRLRWIEWLIAILFMVTLLIASGVFIEVSKAADVRTRSSKDMVLDPQAVIPGTIHSEKPVRKSSPARLPNIGTEMDDNSCELKP